MENNEDMVTITVKEYENLLADSWFLSCLQGCGVDNWEGYSDACDMRDLEDEAE